jgi:hypothetical protein
MTMVTWAGHGVSAVFIGMVAFFLKVGTYIFFIYISPLSPSLSSPLLSELGVRSSVPSFL